MVFAHRYWHLHFQINSLFLYSKTGFFQNKLIRIDLDASIDDITLLEAFMRASIHHYAFT